MGRDHDINGGLFMTAPKIGDQSSLIRASWLCWVWPQHHHVGMSARHPPFVQTVTDPGRGSRITPINLPQTPRIRLSSCVSIPGSQDPGRRRQMFSLRHAKPRRNRSYHLHLKRQTRGERYEFHCFDEFPKQKMWNSYFSPHGRHDDAAGRGGRPTLV